MTSQAVKGTWIRTGGYRQFRLREKTVLNCIEGFTITATNITSIKETKDNDSVKMGEQHGSNHKGCKDLSLLPALLLSKFVCQV